MLIKIQHIGYVYSPGTPLARAALKGIDLEIGPGERVGLVGHTGSGKSTLVQLVAGLIAPTGGQVLLDGVPAHRKTAASRGARRRIGLAFQYPEDQVFEQSVAREVAFGPRNLGLPATDVAERVSWALGIVGLDASMAERVPFTLSGGEMRRVAIAGILAMRSEVLMLDEPAAGLDPRGRRELLGRVLDWQRETGATLIVVSHHLDDVARLADRVIVLADGQVAADGPAGQVLADGALLRAARLSAPEPVALLEALRAAGWNVRTDRLQVDDVVAEIKRAWRDQADRSQVGPCPEPAALEVDR